MIFHKKSIQGFTLIELMIVIAIISLVSITLPAFNHVLANLRLKNCARELYSNLQKARLEAIRRNENVVVQFKKAPYTPAGCKGQYTVFIDDGRGHGGVAEDFIQNGNETMIIKQSMAKNATLVHAAFSGKTTAAGYNGRGLPINSRIGSIELRNPKRWYKITLSIAGNLSLLQSRDGKQWQ